jgi:transposase
MLSLPSRTKVFLCMSPVDMRKSFDGLFGIIREEFQQDPLSGHLFLFVNKRRDRMKAIFWDDDGFVIWYKRLEAGTWQLPGSAATVLELEAHQLVMILRGIDLNSARRRARYQAPVAV